MPKPAARSRIVLAPTCIWVNRHCVLGAKRPCTLHFVDVYTALSRTTTHAGVAMSGGGM